MRICPVCNELTNKEYCQRDKCPTIDEEKLKKSIDPLIGKVFQNRYEIIDLIGEGGMGKVYKGFQLAVSREVAIKILRAEFSEGIEGVKRFHREALVCSKLQHPNTIRIYDFGQADDGSLFFVMEFLKGQKLSEILKKEKTFNPQRVVHITSQVLKSIGEAHSNGIIHRDLKPDNIFITELFGEKDFVKVLDFGIARFAYGSGETSITKAGALIGTPYYMSPEQAYGRKCTHKSDLYSIGIIMYQMLSGNLPFKQDTPMATLMQHVTTPPPPLEFTDIYSKRLVEIIYSLLEKDPDKRPENAEAVLNMLSQIEKIEGMEEIDTIVMPKIEIDKKAKIRRFLRSFIILFIIIGGLISGLIIYKEKKTPEYSEKTLTKQIEKLPSLRFISNALQNSNRRGIEVISIKKIEVIKERQEKKPIKKEEKEKLEKRRKKDEIKML